MIHFRTAVIIVCLLLPVFAQDNAQKILKEVQGKYETINDISADFTQAGQGGNSTKGKFFYKKEQKIRIEFKNLTIIANGQTTWNYNRKDNKVIISNYDESDPFALSMEKLVYDYPKNSVVKDLSKNNQKILELTPQSSEYNFKNIKIWIDKDNLINKVVFEDITSGTTEITFSGYNLNSGLTDSKFSFTAPEGCSVIDLR